MKKRIVHWAQGPNQCTKRDDGKEMWAAKIACAGQVAQIPKDHEQHGNVAHVTCVYCLEAMMIQRLKEVSWAKRTVKELGKQTKPKLRYTLRSVVKKIESGAIDEEILERIRNS